MRHLITISDLQKQDVYAIFSKAEYYLTNSTECLYNKSVINLFFETSTRTLTSFAIAAQKLRASVINMPVQFSALKKGESIADTIATLHSISPEFIVIRSGNSGIPFMAAQESRSSIINAGDGCNEHPTQALIDAFTIKSLFGDLNGLEVAICGDVLHSRVAHSNIKLLTLLGARVRVIAPPTLLPQHLPDGVKKYNNVLDALKNVDVIMVLRLQYERMKKSYVASSAEYYKCYGIDVTKLECAKGSAVIMHPGPINRDIEISSEVADNNHSVILKQVKFSVPIRQAIFDFLSSFV